VTAQISDLVRFRGLDYSVAGVSGAGLFDPSAHGITPRMISTACRRGYYCTYVVDGARLTLDTLHVGLNEEDAERAERGEAPLLFGVVPCAEQEGCFAYTSLAAAIYYTGGLLLGRDLIPELYVHMGFHPYWKFRHVLELLFASGHLVEARDHSAAAEEFRQNLHPQDLRPSRSATRAEIEERTFSLRYDPL